MSMQYMGGYAPGELPPGALYPVDPTEMQYVGGYGPDELPPGALYPMQPDHGWDYAWD